MTGKGMTRRGALRSGAGVIAAGALGAPMVHAQGTGGSLRVAFWDHWVPTGNDAMRALVKEWSEKNRVEVTLDFINTTGNQLQLAGAAQAQSKSGHDIISLAPWDVGTYASVLEPVDDVINRLIAKYGPINPVAEYLAKREGAWRGVPATSGTQNKPACVRFDLMQEHAGLDVRAMWPASGQPGPGADQWTWDTFLTAAEKCAKAGYPFGLPLGAFSDAVDWVGALFASYGASMMDEKGKPTVRNNPKLRTAIEYAVRLSKTLPNDVWAWDDASNNRALISGKSALVFNPPSAWAVAKRDQPQVAEKCAKAGFPFGLPLGAFSDAVDWVGALFASYGASMMDEKGKPTVRNNPKLRTAIEYAVRLSKALPNDVWAWDDASNNRALISGRSALVFNPPSAWAVAKRDQPQVAEKCWTIPMPAGPEGRFLAYLPWTSGIWNFGRNKQTAKALLEFLGERSSAEALTSKTSGYDIPPFETMTDFKIWETEGPPVGTVYNYPLKPHHKAKPSIAFAPAPGEFAAQMYVQALNTKVIARVAQGGDTVDQALGWLERELTTIVRGG